MKGLRKDLCTVHGTWALRSTALG
ncbi:hypothetical protein [Nitrosospira sp. Is2]